MKRLLEYSSGLFSFKENIKKANPSFYVFDKIKDWFVEDENLFISCKKNLEFIKQRLRFQPERSQRLFQSSFKVNEVIVLDFARNDTYCGEKQNPSLVAKLRFFRFRDPRLSNAQSDFDSAALRVKRTIISKTKLPQSLRTL